MSPKFVNMPLDETLLQTVSQSTLKKIPRGTVTLKVVIVGNPGVGKTSLVYRFAEGHLPVEYKPTLGVNILTKTIHVSKETEVKWIIWDVGSQRRMEHLRKVFYRGARAIVLVFDKNDPTSRNALETTWWHELLEANINMAKVPVVFVANKCDTVTRDDIMAGSSVLFLKDAAFPVIETSALSGKNIDSLFEYLTNLCLIVH